MLFVVGFVWGVFCTALVMGWLWVRDAERQYKAGMEQGRIRQGLWASEVFRDYHARMEALSGRN